MKEVKREAETPQTFELLIFLFFPTVEAIRLLEKDPNSQLRSFTWTC